MQISPFLRILKEDGDTNSVEADVSKKCLPEVGEFNSSKQHLSSIAGSHILYSAKISNTEVVL